MVTRSKKILVVEDEPDILELLSEVLGNLDSCEILLARDGEEAINIARITNPDIMLLDVNLPKLDGYDVCKLVKLGKSRYTIKVIIMSGGAQNSDRLRAQQVGADGYITKPFSSVVLLDKIKTLLNIE